MATRKKSTQSVGSLKPQTLSTKKAKSVKGGLLPAVLKVRGAMGDGSVRMGDGSVRVADAAALKQ